MKDFNRIYHDLSSNGEMFYGMRVMKDNSLLYHNEVEIGKRYPIYSATKTITAIGIGLAVQEGKMDINRPIFDYLPECYAKYRKEELTIERCMTMSISGYPFRASSEDWLEYALSYPLSGVGKRQFDYSNIPAYLVGVCLSYAVGEHVISYLTPRLFEPLDIENPSFINCPAGYFYGATGMELSIEELSRVGQMFLNKGVYLGERILSTEWLERANSARIKNREGGYGYYIWCAADYFYISGKWGQKCFIYPKGNMTITCLAHMEKGSNRIMEEMKGVLHV